MSHRPKHPLLYEVNTWVWLEELSRQAGRRITLDAVPQEELERLAGHGFDALWLMGVWERSPAGRQIARQHPGLQEAYRRLLPDYTPDDVVGSPYAVHRYRVDPHLGGDEALDKLRRRLFRLGLRLVLDFVPNHLALDHPWVAEHPERLLQGRPEDLAEGKGVSAHGRIYLHGRDPHFPPWSDTVQLDYRRPETRRAMTNLLLHLAERCDGLRCDMAMLVTREVFTHTWGGAFDPPDAEFWPAALEQVHRAHPDLFTLAEVYWDLEPLLLQMGMNCCYDKGLYDRLREGDATRVREHLRRGGPALQNALLRFVENHDEERAAAAFGPERGRAAALFALTLPGARLVHDGQIEGRRVRLPVQLGRRPAEPPDPETERFYRALLPALRAPVFHQERWAIPEPQPACPGDEGYRNLLATWWEGPEEARLAVANLSPRPAQGIIPLDRPGLRGHGWELEDLLGPTRLLRDGQELFLRGLRLNLPACGYHLFRLRRL